ncbi:MAG: hypothetical protein KJ718_01725 [Nanoarchaeota archaeon]|nr:hypothetical protein [Nanoarchaeota archaeon]
MARNNEIRIKVNPEEKEIIKRKAERVGMNPSSFLRFLALNSTVSVTLEEE